MPLLPASIPMTRLFAEFAGSGPSGPPLPFVFVAPAAHTHQRPLRSTYRLAIGFTPLAVVRYCTSVCPSLPGPDAVWWTITATGPDDGEPGATAGAVLPAVDLLDRDACAAQHVGELDEHAPAACALARRRVRRVVRVLEVVVAPAVDGHPFGLFQFRRVSHGAISRRVERDRQPICETVSPQRERRAP